MKWKPQIGTIYSIMDKATNKTNLFYQVAELTYNNKHKFYAESDKDCEVLHITYKVYDYRNGKNVNIYYVKLAPLIITAKHSKKDLVIYFQDGHGENRLATHTITDAKNPKVYKTTEDNKVTTTKLYKLLINNTYLCKHNAFTSPYSVEEFYTLYNILNTNHRLFHEIIEPHTELFNRLCEGTNTDYDWMDYTKARYNEMCNHKNIYEKLLNPIVEEDEEDEEQAETTEEEINMY
jgi:hypothetical protein